MAENEVVETEEQQEFDPTMCDEICAKYQDWPGATIPVLQETQEAYGYLFPELVERIADDMNMSPHQIYGVITFYAQFYTKPRGKYIIRVCRGTACHVQGSGRITEIVGEEFGIKDGETSPDLKFTLEEVSCIGACGMAPVIMINNSTYGNLKPEDARKIFKDYASLPEDEV